MSHGDRPDRLAPGFRITASTSNTRVAAVGRAERRLYGVQFHPEVIHTKPGRRDPRELPFPPAGLEADWNMASFIDRKVQEIREAVGKGRVVCGLSGGVDSLATSLILHRAIGDRLTCVFVDNGLLRKGQYEGLMADFRERSPSRSSGWTRPTSSSTGSAASRPPSGSARSSAGLFIKIFEREARKVGGARFLAQGTIYPDVIESNPVKGPSSVIKSHHNVGGLPKGLSFELVEPLRELFKDEVRALAVELGVDRGFVRQHPFPGPGLAVRIVGAVDRESLEILREADDILLREVRRAGFYDRLWQAFAVLLPVRSVGVMGDQRTYQRVIVLRLVQSVDGMTADWFAAPAAFLARVSTRIVNEVRGVNRVVFDITTKPPGTIEWE